MSTISVFEAQELIMSTYKEFSVKLRYNRHNSQGPYPLLYNNSFEWERILSNPEFPNHLFEDLDAESYNYLLERCYELADLYNFSMKKKLKESRVAEEVYITQSFHPLPLQVSLPDRDTGTRQWTDETNYTVWINNYYDFSREIRSLRADISVIRARGGRFLSRQARIEIAEIEGKIRGKEFILADSIHRINTSFYRNMHGIQFITIESDLLQNERLNTSMFQDRITEDGQYHIQQFDRALVRTLTTVRDASSNASLFFLAVGQPHAAVAAGTLSLAAAALLVLRKLFVGDIRGATIDSAFIVAGAQVSRLGAAGVNKLLSISTDTRTINYLLTGNSWATIRDQIYRDFGTLSGDMLSRLLNVAQEAYNAAE